jgi:hypothetical protein
MEVLVEFAAPLVGDPHRRRKAHYLLQEASLGMDLIAFPLGKSAHADEFTETLVKCIDEINPIIDLCVSNGKV